jgi:plastocyanin
MFDRFDSRILRFSDCYGQRFMRPGTYRYHVLPATGFAVAVDKPFVINVGERKSTNVMNQQTVLLKFENQRFVPDKPELTIETGDLVIWNCPDRTAPGYVVSGDKEFFASVRLVNECGYSHAFGMPGTYEWKDAYGSDVHGVIDVAEPPKIDFTKRAELDAWREKLTQAALVTIDKDGAQPEKIDIVTGQTVYFAVTMSRGISITDLRLFFPQG